MSVSSSYMGHESSENSVKNEVLCWRRSTVVLYTHQVRGGGDPSKVHTRLKNKGARALTFQKVLDQVASTPCRL